MYLPLTVPASFVAAKEAGLHVALPTCDVAGKAICSGAGAKCFGRYMRCHALEGTGMGFIVPCAGRLGRSRPVKEPVVQRIPHKLGTS